LKKPDPKLGIDYVLLSESIIVEAVEPVIHPAPLYSLNEIEDVCRNSLLGHPKIKPHSYIFNSRGYKYGSLYLSIYLPELQNHKKDLILLLIY